MKIIFKTTHVNKYSINTLTRAIEDLDVEIYFESDVSQILNKADKDTIVAFSFMNMNCEKEISDAIKIKENKPYLRIIGGGAYFLSQRNINIFDHIFIGEGELGLRKLIIENINEKIIKPYEVDLNKFGSISEKYKRFGSIEITRGCIHNCFYCQTPKIFGRKLRHKSVDKILEEVEILIRNNFKDIRFITPDLTSYGNSHTGKDISEFKKLVYSLKKFSNKARFFLGSFPSELRPENVTEEFVGLLKEITSSKSVIVGAQSGSNKILKMINRQHDVEDIIRAVEILSSNGFKTDVDFIFGFPFETEDDEIETQKLIDLLVRKYKSRIHIHYFMPLPSTEFENLKPKPLTSKMRRFLSSLTAQKYAYGQWENQLKSSLKS